ncbi:MAG: hypothetical protein WDW20_00500 [Neisseriaceae bacterium]
MLSKDLRTYLAKELGWEYATSLSPERAIQARILLLEHSINPSYSFFDYMTHYNSQCSQGRTHLTSFGDVLKLLQDMQWNNQLYAMGLAKNYIAMKETHGWLFLYQKDEDAVILNDDLDIQRINLEDFDYYWPSFNHFLRYFFGLSKSK